jgi:Golgi nucleoside diphosphatase
MKFITAKILIFLAIFCGTYNLAHTALNKANTSSIPEAQSEYKIENIIVVDMGSTGTRLHAYNIKKSTKLPHNAIPEIQEVALAKSQDNKAIANYCDDPKAVHKHITPLYNQLSEDLIKLNIDINQTPIYFFATAGMRLFNEQQQELVYIELKKTIIELGHKSTLIAQTIPGELEGIFDWLSVNYKLKTIQNNQATVAALDMGGASTQIAMEYNLTENPSNNIYTIKFSDKEYKVYSKSMLGYGLTQTKQGINNYNTRESAQNCNIANKNSYDKFEHQLGFDVNNSITAFKTKNKAPVFNFNTCSKLIKSYLNYKKDHLEIAKVVKESIKKNMQFLAVSGYYYNFKFFNSKQPEDLIKSIPDSCHIRRKEFKRKFPTITEEALNEACFDATYLKILLHNGYNIPENYPHFTIPKHDIDWTIGASLFITTKQNLM